jgi:hypothetical protein
VTTYDLVFWGEAAIADRFIDEMLKGDTMEQEIVIPDEQPGAAPGLGLGDLLRYRELIEAIVKMVTTGAGSFVVSIRGKRWRINVDPA